MRNKIDLAVLIATAAHTGQVDKAGQPYILHPFRVAFRATQNYGLDDPSKDDLFVVALLHDVVEDTKVTLAQLREHGFSDTVLEALEAVTKKGKTESRDDYAKRLRKNKIATLVKLADIADNSSEERLNKLPLDDQIKLKAKYERALNIILGPEDASHA